MTSTRPRESRVHAPVERRAPSLHALVEREPDTEGPRRTAGARGGDPDGVLLGRDQEVCPDRGGSGREGPEVGGVVGVVVREGHQVAGQRAVGGEKARQAARLRDPGEGEDRPPGEGRHRVARPGPEIGEILGLEARGHDGGLGRAATDLGADESQVLRLVGPRQDDQAAVRA